jgi:hypothetical protein
VSETEAKQHLRDMLAAFTPGSVLHILAEVVRQSETTRLGGLDEVALKRVQEAEAFLWIAGYGLMAALPR